MAETEYIAPGLEPWDIVIVVLYFFIILGVGLYVSIFIVLDNRFARVRPQVIRSDFAAVCNSRQSSFDYSFSKPVDLYLNATHLLNDENYAF